MTPSRICAAVAVLLWLVALGTPLTTNSISGTTWTFELLAHLRFLIPIVAVLVVAIAMVLARPRRWLAVTAILIGLLFVWLVIDWQMGVTMWDGVDALGRPTGGMEVDVRSIGWYCALAGSVVLTAAGVLGVLESRAVRRARQRENELPGE